MSETGMEMTRRHVAEQIGRIRRQRELIGRMKQRHLPVDQAESFLSEMFGMLQAMRAHHRRLLKLQMLKPRSNNATVPLLPIAPPAAATDIIPFTRRQ